MRVTIGNQEFAVKFNYNRPKTGTKSDQRIHTRCTLQAGPAGSLDSDKTMLSDITLRRDSRDPSNFVVARTIAFSRALAKSGLSKEMQWAIWDSVPMRKNLEYFQACV